MNPYETIAIVEDQGQVRVAGVPFAPGTEVEVTIKPAHNGGHEEPALTAAEAGPPDATDIFAEMRPYMVDVPDVDDSREAIYTRMEGE